MSMALTFSGIKFLGKLTVDVIGLVLDYGLLTESLTEGTEDYNLITQEVTQTLDFGSIV